MDIPEYAFEPLPDKDDELTLYRGRAIRAETPSFPLRTPVSSRPLREGLKTMERGFAAP